MSAGAIPMPPLPPSSPYQSAEYTKAQNLLVSVRDQPRPGPWNEQIRWEMCGAQTIFTGLLMRVYAYADWAVEHDDLANYLGLADIAFAHLHSHHHFEEDLLFPFLEEAINDNLHRLTKNVEEHRLFDKQLDAAWQYVRVCRAGLTPTPAASPIKIAPGDAKESIDLPAMGLDPAGGFSPKLLRAQMDTWVVPLMQHLEAEVDTLDPDWVVKMGKEKYDVMAKMVAKHLQEMDPTWFLISSIGSLPQSTSKQLMGLPLPVRRLFVPLLWSGKYKGYWKYLEYPQNLTFWGSA